MWALLLFVHFSTTEGAVTSINYFKNEDSCKTAEKQVVSDLKNQNDTAVVSYSCVDWQSYGFKNGH